MDPKKLPSSEIHFLPFVPLPLFCFFAHTNPFCFPFLLRGYWRVLISALGPGCFHYLQLNWQFRDLSRRCPMCGFLIQIQA